MHCLPLPNFVHEYADMLDAEIIVSGWDQASSFSVHANHVSAAGLLSSDCPTLAKALYPTNPDRSIWFDSYTEEFKGLDSNCTYDIIPLLNMKPSKVGVENQFLP